MQESMGKEDLNKALIALGARLRDRTDMVVGGAGALILTGDLPRVTSDFEVLLSNPDMGRLQDDIRAVADQLDLTPGWLNGSIQTYALRPTPQELQFVREELPRLGRIHQARAARIESFLALISG
jgi:hypothetical protein